MKISEKELERAVVGAGLSPDQSHAIWRELQVTPQSEGHFEPAHVGYFFGALLVIGAMGWFITEGWDSFPGWKLTTIATGYAVVFVLGARQLWNRSLFKVPGGLLATIAVCMTPLAIYGVERQLGWWPAASPGSYFNFHPFIHASWILMEIGTVLAGIVALRWFRFPFLTAPIVYALWYMSMDATAYWFGENEWQWHDRCLISAVFGAVTLLVSYWIDGRSDLDFSYWGYLFGLLMFTGGLSGMETGSELAKAGYCLVHLGLIFVSLLLRRKVFLVFGALGVFGYLCNEAYTYFRYSVAFPFLLTLIGIGLIAAAMLYKKNERVLEVRIGGWLSRDVLRLRRI